MSIATRTNPPTGNPSALSPRFGSVIDEMLVNAEEHYETILQTKGRPSVLDDALVARIVQGHTDQLDNHWVKVYAEYGCGSNED